MQNTSDLYKELSASSTSWTETRLAIGEGGVIVTKSAERITFGGHGILTGISGADAGYDESVLRSLTTDTAVFSRSTPEVGCCVAGQIDVKMIMPRGEIQRRARMVPYVRITDGNRRSEWIQKGVFYIDTRQVTMGDNERWITLHGYDAMLLAEADYVSKLTFPATDISIVKEIAKTMDVRIDPRTTKIMTAGYKFPKPEGYSMREILGYIASAYAGSFIMNDAGELRLVQLGALPKDTRYLVVSTADRTTITIGGVRIIVG